MELTLQCKVQYLNDIDPFDVRSTVPEPVRPPSHAFLTNVPLCYQLETLKRFLQAPHKLEDCALQLTKFNGGQLDFLTYLDLEQTLVDQQEELEEFRSNKRNVIILRTQLSVRVQCCLEKLSSAPSSELKKHLFALKQVLQDDKDFVHEFVNLEGLDCLIRISRQTESNSVYHILKVLGQLMLYVDGMNGVIKHNKTIQWLYSFISSQQIRLVVKMALKLLLVFVEYNDTNWQLFTQAVNIEDISAGERPWSNVMKLMKNVELADKEVLTYVMTLINKTLAAVPDQDTFYDITDLLEEQGIDGLMKRYRQSYKEDRELLEQFDTYDSLVSVEDGDVSPQALVMGSRRIPKVRSSEDIKRSRRRSADVGSMPVSSEKFTSHVQLNFFNQHGPHNGFHSADVTKSTPSIPELLVEDTQGDRGADGSLSSSISDVRNDQDSNISISNLHLEDNNKSSFNVPDDDDDDDVKSFSSSAEDVKSQKSYLSNATFLPERPLSSQGRQSMSRRQRRQRQQSQIQEMIQSTSLTPLENEEYIIKNKSHNEEPKDIGLPEINITNENDDVFQIVYNPDVANLDAQSSETCKGKVEETAWVKMPLSNEIQIPELPEQTSNGPTDTNGAAVKISTTFKERVRPTNLSVIGKHLSLEEMISSVPVGNDFASKVCAAKSQLKSTKMPLKKQDSGPTSTSTLGKLCENITKPFMAWNANRFNSKGVESRQDAIHWSNLEKESLKLPIRIKEADFTDLTEHDDQDFLRDHSKVMRTCGSSVDPTAPPPPPPPPNMNIHGSLSNGASPMPGMPPPPPPPPPNMDTLKGGTLQKKKMKLHWREANSHFLTPSGKVGTIWEELKKEVGDVKIDRTKFEALFETKTQDVKTKEKLELSKKELSILDQKRSNAINIGMVHLPKAGAIKNAILSMDNSVLSREDIEKILVGMMPSEDEKAKIVEAQRTNNLNDLQLGTAEQFLLTMGSISELESRLRLWIYKMDYDAIESEICDPLFDLKKGMEELKRCKTFKFILSGLLSVGNFLNNSQVPGFTLDYLVRVTEVKDNVYRHTLLHHLVNVILDTFPESSDLYSDIGSIIRCAKVDWDDLKEKLIKLEADCDCSVEHLKSIVKHDSTFQAKHRMQETLNDFARRIVLVKIVYRRVINRFKKFLLWLGYSAEEARTVSVNQLCQAISEFALEYRTTREKVNNIRMKKANMRERKKTRGVMIVQTRKFASKAKKLPTLGENGGGELELLLQNETGLVPSKSRGRRSLDLRTFQRSLSSFKSNESDQSISIKVDGEETRSDGTKEMEAGTNTPLSSDSPDDDLLEAVLRSVTSTNEPKTRERRRARNVERKSLRRTLKSGLSKEEAAVVAKFS